MSNLIEVFRELGYASETQHLAIVKLMTFDNVFSEPTSKESSESRLISDDAAKKILASLNFNSLEAAMNFFIESTDKVWLRSTHQKEGTNVQNQASNTVRWTEEEPEKYKKYKEELIKLLTSLNMVNQSPTWPKNVNYNHVIVHGALEIPQMKERLEALEPFEGILYYLTSPRGCFNDEPSVAEIIADWLGKPEKVNLIRKVLLEHKDSSNWLNNLTAVKKAILEVTDTSNWPTGKGFYYLDPSIYQENGKDKEGKLVKDLKDWPVAADIVAHRLKKMQVSHPGQFDKVKLVALPTLGKMGKGSDGKPDRKIANTDDNVELWFKDYGQKLLLDKQNQKSTQDQKIKILFISSEAQREFQHQIACKYLSPAHFEVLTICKKAPEIKVNFVLDSLTRLFYVKREAWLKKKAGSGIAQPILTQSTIATTNSNSSISAKESMAKIASSSFVPSFVSSSTPSSAISPNQTDNVSIATIEAQPGISTKAPLKK